jgi:hypothetical protein
MFDFGFQISDVDRLGESFRCRQKVVIIASENLEKLEIGNPPDQLSLLFIIVRSKSFSRLEIRN